MDEAEAREVITAALARIAPEIDLAECDSSAPMTSELDLDSMDMLSLLTAVGERTGIQVPDADAQPDWSVDQFAAYLAAR